MGRLGLGLGLVLGLGLGLALGLQLGIGIGFRRNHSCSSTFTPGHNHSLSLTSIHSNEEHVFVVCNRMDVNTSDCGYTAHPRCMWKPKQSWSNTSTNLGRFRQRVEQKYQVTFGDYSCVSSITITEQNYMRCVCVCVCVMCHFE